MERSVAGILIDGRKVFVAKRGEGGSFRGYWEFPGGKVEPGESDEAALVREFLEEFGIVVRPQRLLGEVVFQHRGIDRALAAWLIEAELPMEPKLHEHDETAWAGAGELSNFLLVDSDKDLLPYLLPLIGE